MNFAISNISALSVGSDSSAAISAASFFGSRKADAASCIAIRIASDCDKPICCNLINARRVFVSSSIEIILDTLLKVANSMLVKSSISLGVER